MSVRTQTLVEIDQLEHDGRIRGPPHNNVDPEYAIGPADIPDTLSNI